MKEVIKINQHLVEKGVDLYNDTNYKITTPTIYLIFFFLLLLCDQICLCLLVSQQVMLHDNKSVKEK